MLVKTFFDHATYTLTYVAYDQQTKDAVIIDPVWDYDPASSSLSTSSKDQLMEFINSQDLNPLLVLETHAHADHLSSSQLLKKEFPHAKIAIGSGITQVQETFKPVFDFGKEFSTDGSQFDLLLDDNEIIKAGSLEIKVIHTPGHTPACTSFLIGDSVFVGDAILMPDQGTGRCDFPAGDASNLYDSIASKLYSLPNDTTVYVGHDYQPKGRELAFKTTIGEEKENNIHLKENTSKEKFVSYRTTRDKELAAPKLLLPSVQVNIAAGSLPKNERGQPFLQIPVRGV